MGLWHKYAWVAYLAVFLSVCGHASSEFVSVLCGIKGPELSVWRFLLGSFGLVILALIFPVSRNLLKPFREYGFQLVWLSILGISIGYLLFHWSLDYATVPQVATMITIGPIFVGLVNLWLNKLREAGNISAKITSPKLPSKKRQTDSSGPLIPQSTETNSLEACPHTLKNTAI